MTREETDHLFVIKHYNKHGLADLDELSKLYDKISFEKVIDHHIRGFENDGWAKRIDNNISKLTDYGKIRKKNLIEKDKREDRFWMPVIVSILAGGIALATLIYNVTQKPDTHLLEQESAQHSLLLEQLNNENLRVNEMVKNHEASLKQVKDSLGIK